MSITPLPISSMGTRWRFMARHWLRRSVCAVAILLASLTAWATEYHGQVFFQGMPVPGATVTVSQGTKQLATVTDEQGLYEFPDLADGSWKIEIQIRGFSTLKANVTIAPDVPQGHWELQLLDLAEMQDESKSVKPESPPQLAQRAEEKPKQEADNGGMPPPPDDSADNSADGLLINGTSNNANTSKFSLSPSFGNHRPGTKGLYTGGFGAAVSNSIFDAKPYSLTGIDLPKAAYNRVTGVATLGGPVDIPHLFYHGPNFFVAYQWTRNANAVTDPGLVPTLAERSGDLSGALNALGQPVTVYDPTTAQTLAGPIPVRPQAAAP